MTTNTARQPKGIPVGGQFAATAHTESTVSLAPARRPELEGWPEHLPEPEVSFHFGQNNSITTNVAVNGESVFEVWNPEDEDDPIETTCFEMGWTESDVDAAEAWAKQKHQQINDDLRAEISATVERARARVLAKATGVRKPVTDEELTPLVYNGQAVARVNRDMELASAALAARRILEEHPDAAFATLRTSSWDNGTFIDGAIISGADFKELANYSDDTDEGNRQVVELLGNLEAEPGKSWWSGEFSVGYHFEEQNTIDLRKAAAWAPGDDL